MTPVGAGLAFHRPRPMAGRVAALGARVRAVPLPLRLILVVAALNAFAWSIATPPLQGPDETAHMAYVQHLAETGSPPKKLLFDDAAVSDEQGTAMILAGLSPLPTVTLARPSWAQADVREWHDTSPRLPAGARKNGGGPNPVAQNPPLYYAYAAAPYWVGRALGLDFFGRLMLIRWTGGLLYLATIALVWVLAAELFAATWLRTVATATVALVPQLAFLGAIVNPDIMLVAIWTGFLALAARTMRLGPSLTRVAGLGALTAGSILSHGRGLALIPPLAVAVGLSVWRHRPPRRDALAWCGAAAGLLAVGGLVAFLVTRASSSGSAYGGAVATTTTGGGAFNVRQFLSYVWQFYLPKLPSMSPTVGPQGFGFRQIYVESFFGQFGSLDVRFSAQIYDMLFVFAILGLAGLYTAMVARWQLFRARWDVAAVLAVTFLSLIAVLHLAAYRQLTHGSNDPLLQGRYLLPCVGLLGVGMAMLCRNLPRRPGAALAGAVLALGVLLSLGGLVVSMARFYA